jgi:hypothetical protein
MARTLLASWHGNALEDMITKVEKSLSKVIIRGKRRKRGVARKVLAAA